MKKKSIWKDVKSKKLNKINHNLDVDVLIIGGGITGISVLHNLISNGFNVALTERNICGYGVTSNSTAKITYAQEKIITNIRNMVGYDEASSYLKSQIEAVNLLKNIIQKENINCDLQLVDSYVFTNEEDNVSKIEDEFNFYKDNGINAELMDSMPANIPSIKAIKVPGTYVFHPLKYINYFKNKYKNFIYEDSKVESIKQDDKGYVCTVNGFPVRAKYVVIASHYPSFLFPFLMPLKSHIETSYIGAKVVDKLQDFSAINIDKPTISIRYHASRDSKYLVYLYNSFISANIKSIYNNFLALNDKEIFDYVWSNNDIITNDYMPYIGSIDNTHTLLMATGYNTWGFTNATLAGVIIKDIILKKDNPYIKLFNPNRKISLSKLVRFPIDMSFNIKAMIKSTKGNVNNANVIHKEINGVAVIVYKDKNGIEHIVKDKCPHMKCGIIFNEVENTWECLCHGSRFDIDGKCINGPSNYDITFNDIS